MSAPDTPAAPFDPRLAGTLLRALLGTTREIIYFKDRESRFLVVSRSKATRHNTTASEMTGRVDADYFTEDIAQWSRVDEEGIIATGEPLLDHLRETRWLDGRQGWVQNNKFPLRDTSGQIIGTWGISRDVTEQQEMAHQLEQSRRDLVDTSRQAGMAEVATGVLHNVGNVLNSLNVSAEVLANGLRQSKADTLQRLSALLAEQGDNVGNFLGSDPKGRRVPELLASLAQHMAQERERLLAELESLQSNIDHIKEIITMQQTYATSAGVVEPLDAASLVEDAIRMNTGTLLRHSVSVVREYHPVAPVLAERARVLQILINLIRNAKYACDEGGASDKLITLRILPGALGRVQIMVQDNGIGIPPENLPKLFQHGFTTRKEGHGFGLHSARDAANALNATLTAASDGIGHGATFTLDLPALGG